MKLRWFLLATLAACASDPPPCDPTAPNTICTIAGHTIDEGYAGDDGPATSADLGIVMDAAVAPDGTVWVIDFNNYVVRQIDAHGTIHTVIGNHQLGDSPSSDGLTSIAALQAANNHTPSMTFAGGYLYLPAWHESRVKRVRLADMMMENVGGRASRDHYDGDEGPAEMAGIDLPSSVALDPQGNVVFMDQGNLVVRMIDATQTIHTIVGKCIIESPTPCAPGQTPVACPGSEKLTCGDPAVACVPGNECTQVSSGDGGPAVDARLDLPFTQFADPAGRIAYDHHGNLIIAETGGNKLRKVDPSGTITTIAGTGTAGYAGDGGPAAQAQLNHPVDLAIADDDTIYFTDVYNHCVRAIDPAGVISTVAGACHASEEGEGGAFSGDGGPPLEAQMNKPYGIELAGKKLYVADSYNNRLRVVNLP